MRVIVVIALCLAAVAAAPRNPQRIIGGDLTTISRYPTAAALLYSWNLSSFVQTCGGVILNTRNILTVAHCADGDTVDRWRVRVGSSYAHSDGVVHNFISNTIHNNYNRNTYESDISVMRTSTVITYNNNVRPATIAATNYVLNDDQILWAVGWGATSVGDSSAEQLRHVLVWSINQDVCVRRYAELRRNITPNMLCSGWLDEGGRDQCYGDDGGPVYHNLAVVGLSSWAESCALPYYPRVNTRLSRFNTWIQGRL